MPEFKKDPNEIGALWIKTSKAGGEFLSGTINGEEVVCFRNTRQTSNTQPAYRVLKSRPRDGMATPPAETHNANATQLTDDDIPF